MDKIKKFLKKLTAEEHLVVINLIEKIISGDLEQLDVKRLQGYSDIYRVRKGNLRVIFRKTAADTLIMEITRRSDTTYRKY